MEDLSEVCISKDILAHIFPFYDSPTVSYRPCLTSSRIPGSGVKVVWYVWCHPWASAAAVRSIVEKVMQ